jgi:uncharacterized protein YukE
MAEKFDAASRLAEGRPAVDNVQSYVWACHLLGYQNPDLTLHASQVYDWYASEDGLDLLALDADCAAFHAMVATTEEALARQENQLAAMPAVWQGRGADASREFLRRHGEASAAAAAAVRTAADALTALRDNLWHAVDGKVAAALAIDDRRLVERAEWLAATQTVMTGAGDRAAASELVDQRVKPFVDNDIGSDWLTAMRAAIAAVTDAYEAATAELAAEPDAAFDVPGDLGPSWTPPPRDDDVPTTPAAAASSPPPVASAPASWIAPPAAPAPMPAPAAAPPLMPPMPPPATPVEPTAPAMAAPPMPSLGGMGGGMPDIGSGLSGFGQELGETLGGLFGSADDALSDPQELDEPPELDEPDDESEDPLDDELDESAADGEVAEVEEAEDNVDPAVDTGDACAEETDAVPAEVPPPAAPPPPPEPVPTPAPLPPPPPEPTPPPEPMAATETPCEIAADELPQVGQ